MNQLCQILFIQLEKATLESKKVIFQRLKFIKITKELKNIKKIQRSNNYNSINSNYDTINTVNSHQTGAVELSKYNTNDFKPLQNLYTSIKIINGEKHNLNLQKITRNKIKISQIQKIPVNKQLFLQNWMVRSEKQLITVQNYPKSQFCYKKISAYNKQALTCIEQGKFYDFIPQILRKKKSWGKQINTMQYRTQSLPHSLTLIPPAHEQYAIEMFDLVLKFGGQKYGQYPFYYYGAQIVNLVINAPIEQLRQQIFLQVIKQMTSTKQIYLKLFVLICALIRPSFRLYIPLLHFIKSKSDFYPNEEQYFSFAFFALIKNFDDARSVGCTIYQANMIMNLRKIPILVGFPTNKSFFVQFFTSCNQFIQQLIEFFDLDRDLKYLIYFQTCLFQQGKILDNFYKIDMNSDQKKVYTAFKGFKILIVLKNMLDLKNSVKAFNIMYNYFAHQYLNNYYFLTKDEVLDVAALKLLSEIEDEQNHTIELNQLIPSRFLNKYKDLPVELAKKILIKYVDLKFTKIQARKQILKIIKKRQNFMAHFFKGQIYFHDEQMIYDVVIGVKPTKFLLIDYQTGRYIKKINYNKIIKWGKSKSEICLIVDPFGKIHIESIYINLIIEIFNTYLHEMVKYVE